MRSLKETLSIIFAASLVPVLWTLDDLISLTVWLHKQLSDVVLCLIGENNKPSFNWKMALALGIVYTPLIIIIYKVVQ